MALNSLIEYLETLRLRGDDVAFIEQRGFRTYSCTYAELMLRAEAYAAILAKHHVEKGDRVLLWGDNSANWVAAFIGCLMGGGVAVPMDRIAAPDFIRRVVEQTSARVAFTELELAPVLPNMDVLPLNAPAAPARPQAPTTKVTPTLTRNDLAEIVFTSGTTAEPRGVALSHGNLLASIEPLEAQIRPYLRYERPFHPLRFVVLLPLSHVFGQLLSILIPPLLGAAVIFPNNLRPGEILRTLRRERATVLVTVPRMLESVRETIERELKAEGKLEKFRTDFAAAEGKHFIRRCWTFRSVHGKTGWKFWAFICGGAALPAEAETFWRRIGYAVIQGYGLTETTSLVTVNHPFRTGKGSIGKALPGLGIRVDPSGEVMVRGENVAVGYWRGDTLQPVTDKEGWFHTGDVGEQDAQGNLYFRGRQKNVIVTPAGLNIYPGDLEAALRRQAGARDCVVVGVDSGGNAEPCAVLLLKNPQGDAVTIVQAANSELADFQRIRKWLVWPEADFPRTSTQKPVLREIQRIAQKQFGTTAENGVSEGRAVEGAQYWLSRFLQSRGVGASARSGANQPQDLSPLSSLDRVELAGLLEDHYQVELDETAFSEAKTAAEIENLICRPPPAQQPFIYPRWSRPWPMRWLREIAWRLLVAPAIYLIAKPQTRGLGHLRGIRGPAIIISNHVADYDSGLIMAALPSWMRHRLAIAMGGERLRDFRHPVGNNPFTRLLRRIQYILLVTIFNVFPLPKHAGFRESFSYIGELVDHGWNILIFPEGEVTQDDNVHPFRAGIGLLVSRLHVPVIPARINSIYELRKSGQHFAKFGTVHITFGAPMRFPEDTPAADITHELENRVRGL
jgi:long-chain acyl-CoA synthetase